MAPPLRHFYRFFPDISHAEAERIGVRRDHARNFCPYGPSTRWLIRKIVGDISNACCIVGSSAVAVIDTSGTYALGKALHAAITQITDKPIRYVINTHMHPDHVLGNAAFEGAGTEFVGHHKLPAALSARAESYLRNTRDRVGEKAFAGTKIVLPTRTVTDVLDLDLGGRVLTLRARPTAHTDNDLTISDSATGTLFLGDLLFSDHIPTLDGSIVGWLKLIPVLKQEAAARAVPGHGPKTMTWPDAIDRGAALPRNACARCSSHDQGRQDDRAGRCDGGSIGEGESGSSSKSITP